jgi:hypothetical protein
MKAGKPRRALECLAAKTIAIMGRHPGAFSSFQVWHDRSRPQVTAGSIPAERRSEDKHPRDFGTSGARTCSQSRRHESVLIVHTHISTWPWQEATTTRASGYGRERRNCQLWSSLSFQQVLGTSMAFQSDPQIISLAPCQMAYYNLFGGTTHFLIT